MRDYATDDEMLARVGPLGALLIARFYTGGYPEMWADAFAGWMHNQVHHLPEPGWVSDMPANWPTIYKGVEYSLAITAFP